MSYAPMPLVIICIREHSTEKKIAIAIEKEL
jgi:hypothetical protein